MKRAKNLDERTLLYSSFISFKLVSNVLKRSKLMSIIRPGY